MAVSRHACGECTFYCQKNHIITIDSCEYATVGGTCRGKDHDAHSCGVFHARKLKKLMLDVKKLMSDSKSTSKEDIEEKVCLLCRGDGLIDDFHSKQDCPQRRRSCSESGYEGGEHKYSCNSRRVFEACSKNYSDSEPHLLVNFPYHNAKSRVFERAQMIQAK